MADQDLIERLTQQAGGVKTIAPGGGVLVCFHPEDLQRLVALVAEECAKECEARGRSYWEAKAPGWFEVDHEADQNAYAIRAKFKEPTNG